ncbi:hypothetical protein LXA43DRAFT_1067334 [Ganoderma leucocontextum]|nr:hypothetical protein LXA43DRAFT_1067334 [Ganoderma leucocontextum]
MTPTSAHPPFDHSDLFNSVRWSSSRVPVLSGLHGADFQISAGHIQLDGPHGSCIMQATENHLARYQNAPYLLLRQQVDNLRHRVLELETENHVYKKNYEDIIAKLPQLIGMDPDESIKTQLTPTSSKGRVLLGHGWEFPKPLRPDGARLKWWESGKWKEERNQGGGKQGQHDDSINMAQHYLEDKNGVMVSGYVAMDVRRRMRACIHSLLWSGQATPTENNLGHEARAYIHVTMSRGFEFLCYCDNGTWKTDTLLKQMYSYVTKGFDIESPVPKKRKRDGGKDNANKRAKLDPPASSLPPPSFDLAPLQPPSVNPAPPSFMSPTLRPASFELLSPSTEPVQLPTPSSFPAALPLPSFQPAPLLPSSSLPPLFPPSLSSSGVLPPSLSSSGVLPPSSLSGTPPLSSSSGTLPPSSSSGMPPTSSSSGTPLPSSSSGTPPPSSLSCSPPLLSSSSTPPPSSSSGTPPPSSLAGMPSPSSSSPAPPSSSSAAAPPSSSSTVALSSSSPSAAPLSPSPDGLHPQSSFAQGQSALSPPTPLPPPSTEPMPPSRGPPKPRAIVPVKTPFASVQTPTGRPGHDIGTPELNPASPQPIGPLSSATTTATNGSASRPSESQASRDPELAPQAGSKPTRRRMPKDKEPARLAYQEGIASEQLIEGHHRRNLYLKRLLDMDPDLAITYGQFKDAFRNLSEDIRKELNEATREARRAKRAKPVVA